MSNTVELRRILSPEVYERLQAEAERKQADMNDLIREAVEEYLDFMDEEDTPDEKIEADLKQAWHEAMTGQTIPADEALAAIRQARKCDKALLF